VVHNVTQTSRNSSFFGNQEPISNTKSLRLNAREAAEYLSGIPYVPEYDPDVVMRTPGVGANGESSN